VSELDVFAISGMLSEARSYGIVVLRDRCVIDVFPSNNEVE